MSLTDEESFLLSGLPTSEENTRQDERTALLASIEEKVKGLERFGYFQMADGRVYLSSNPDSKLIMLADVLAMLEAMK